MSTNAAPRYCMDWPLCGHRNDADCEASAHGMMLDSPAFPLPENLRALAAEAMALLTDEEAATDPERRQHYRDSRRVILDQLEREGLR